jgi:hypothetical protein
VTVRCQHCGREFVRRRSDHRFCSSPCRRAAGELPPLTLASVRRLFDESRDPLETVRDDDWHPSDDPGWHALDSVQTVEQRRRWYQKLLRHPLLG